jgi:chromate reductase
MTVYNVGLIIGSIASASINRRLASALVKLAPQADLNLTEIPIAPLPFYSYDNDGSIPAEAAEFKAAIEAADGIVIVTPEYNRSVPGVLKNALDTASRPWGTNSFAGKPSAVIGASVGAIGTAVAQQHLRSIPRSSPRRNWRSPRATCRCATASSPTTATSPTPRRKSSSCRG